MTIVLAILGLVVCFAFARAAGYHPDTSIYGRHPGDLP